MLTVKHHSVKALFSIVFLINIGILKPACIRLYNSCQSKDRKRARIRTQKSHSYTQYIHRLTELLPHRKIHTQRDDTQKNYDTHINMCGLPTKNKQVRHNS